MQCDLQQMQLYCQQYAEFPDDLMNKIIDISPTSLINGCMNIDTLTNCIVTLYNTLHTNIIDGNNKIGWYQEQHLKMLQELNEARKAEKLNEYDIDIDSQIYVTVVQAMGLPMGDYYVNVNCFTSTISTNVSSSGNPEWKQELQFNVPSPHGQLFIQLIQQKHDGTTKIIGQLTLPLFNFKDQQHSQDDYMLEDESGVLGNSKQRLQLIVWWVHSKVALIEDHLTQVDSFKNEIGVIRSAIQVDQKYTNIIKEVFNKRRIVEKPIDQSIQHISNIQHPQEVMGQQQQSYSNQQQQHDNDNQFQQWMYKIAKLFKQDHQDSVKEWQQLVLILSLGICIFTIIFVLMARPCLQHLVVVMSIGMLIWAHEQDHIRTTRILEQLSIILLVSILFDLIWLMIDYDAWWSKIGLMEERQVQSDHAINYISYYSTIIYIPFDAMLCASTYNLQLKYKLSIIRVDDL